VSHHSSTAIAQPWPTSARFDDGGLEVAGLAASELARAFGTPLLVIDEEDVRLRSRAFATAFDTALYAVKALTSRRLIRVVAEEGLGALAASGGELRAALEAGVPPARLALHGNNKDDDELRLAVGAGVGLVICDNTYELERLSSIAFRAGVRQPILLRVIPSISAGAHPSIETGGDDSKFGMTPDEAISVFRHASASPGIVPVGVHTHVGSQIDGARPFLSAVDALVDIASRAAEATGTAPRRFDIGGGFPAVYVDEETLEIVTIAGAVSSRLRDGLARRGLPPGELIVEPGRAIVANAGITLYRVGSVKVRAGRVLAAVDGGMSDNIRPALYGARYTVAFASPVAGRPVRTVDVVGRHCESGDVIARGCRLPEPRPGDLLAVAATGAYCYSMASNYNQVGRPAVVGVRDGRATPWLRRETADDLRALEVGFPAQPFVHVAAASSVP